MRIVDRLIATLWPSRRRKTLDADKTPEIEPAAIGPRLGVAKGLFAVPDNIDEDNDIIAAMFLTID